MASVWPSGSPREAAASTDRSSGPVFLLTAMGPRPLQEDDGKLVTQFIGLIRWTVSPGKDMGKGWHEYQQGPHFTSAVLRSLGQPSEINVIVELHAAAKPLVLTG